MEVDVDPFTVYAAPPFTLPAVGGGMVRLEDFGGRIVVLNFWASYCTSCRAEARGLEEVWRAYEGKGVTFIGINMAERSDDARRYVEEFSITYPIGLDGKAETIFEYGVRTPSTTFFITGGGKVVYVYEGPLDEEQLAALIEYTRRAEGSL